MVISVGKMRFLCINQAVIVHQQILGLKWQNTCEAYRMKNAKQSEHGCIAVQSLKAIG